MKVKIQNMGWSAGFAPLFADWYRYLCTAANGIVTWVNTTQYIQDGEYELPEEDWSYDNPRWEKEAEQVCEEIEVV